MLVGLELSSWTPKNSNNVTSGSMNPGWIYQGCHPKKVKNYSILTGVTPGYPRIKPCSFTDLDTFPQALSAAATLQTPCQAALIAAYVHHSHWALGRNHGPLAVETHQMSSWVWKPSQDAFPMWNDTVFLAFQRSRGVSMVRLVRAVLVCGFKHLLFSMSYMGCHPPHWRTPSFFKMVIAPPTRVYMY